MLRALRNQTKSIFFKCFLVLLICGFALWGVGDLTGGVGEKKVLTVDSDYVTVEKVINELNRIRYSLPERPSLQEAIKKGMHQSVLQKFEQEMLLNSEAKSLKLSVPMVVKTKAIREENAFKDPLGKFSQNKFLQSLKNAGLSEAKYLEMINTEANFKQISMPYSLNEIYDDKIIKKLMDWQNETRTINYEIFEMINKNEISKPTDVVLQKFYNANEANYKIPLSRNIRFLEIDPSIFEDQVVINQKQINDKYEIEKSNYLVQEKREILQITTQDQEKATKFIDLIDKGNDFNDLAKKYFDLSENDTNIGLLEKSELPVDSADKIFKANLNEVLGPIKTKFGFSIYKIINIAKEKEVKYEDAIKDVEKKLVKELSVEILFEKLDEVEDLIAEGNNLDEISKSELFNKKNVPVKNIKMISKDGVIYSYLTEKKFLGKNKVFLNNIWNTDVAELSEIFNSNEDTYNLIEVISENPEEFPPFVKVKTNVYNDWLNKELVLKSKEKVEESVLRKNSLSSKVIVERTSKSIDKINDAFLVNKIFNIENKEINFLRSQNYIFAVKVLKKMTKKYTFNREIYNNLHKTLSRSFFNDFSNFYFQNLALKHKLKRNYTEIDKFLNEQEINN